MYRLTIELPDWLVDRLLDIAHDSNKPLKIVAQEAITDALMLLDINRLRQQYEQDNNTQGDVNQLP